MFVESEKPSDKGGMLEEWVGSLPQETVSLGEWQEAKAQVVVGEYQLVQYN